MVHGGWSMVAMGGMSVRLWLCECPAYCTLILYRVYRVQLYRSSDVGLRTGAGLRQKSKITLITVE